MSIPKKKHPLYQIFVKKFKLPISTIALWIGYSRQSVSYHLNGIYNFPGVETALIDLKAKIEENFPNVKAV